jgi:hypothetical protein
MRVNYFFEITYSNNAMYWDDKQAMIHKLEKETRAGFTKFSSSFS